MSGQPIIVCFTQDLRLADNACLHAAVASGHPVLPVYILDDVTPGAFVMGGASRWWLHRSLAALAVVAGEAGRQVDHSPRRARQTAWRDDRADRRESGAFFARVCALVR